VKPFRFGVNAWSANSRAEWADKARELEELGFGTRLVPDHLWSERTARAPPQAGPVLPFMPEEVYAQGGRMGEMGTLTIHLPREFLEQLDALAVRTRRSKSSLAGEALSAYLAAQEWQVAAISHAVEVADAGASPVEHPSVASWLRSWGTESELPRPR
jgi:predicted transcriptional regulator